MAEKDTDALHIIESQQDGNSPHIWRGPPLNNLNLPECDILSYVFAAEGQYDLDKPILIDATNGNHFVSMRKARTFVQQMIRGWQVLGLNEGDCVCLNSTNNIYWPILFLGIVAAGGCTSGCNPAYTVPELIHSFKVTKTKFIITQIDTLPAVIEAADHCAISRSRILLLASVKEHLPAGYRSWETLLEHGSSEWKSFDTKFQSRDTIAFLASTSGTTGLPKAAALSHQYFIVQDLLRQQAGIHVDSEIVQLLFLPMFHAFAGQIALLTPLRHGIATVILPRFTLNNFIHAVSEFTITDTTIVPPIATAILSIDKPLVHRLESLRYIVCAGAPLAAHLQSRMYHYLSPSAVVAQLWGTTETAWFTTLPRSEKDESASVGRLLPGTELKMVNDHGQHIKEDNVRGEALIRTPSMFSGYLSNPEANASAFDSQGFFRTGDLAYYQDGKVYLDGRIKDIMKVRGWQVSPAELEGVLITHPLVKDVAVVGRSHCNSLGLEETLPCAFIVPRDLSSLPVDLSPLTPQCLHDFMEGKVASFKKLTGGIIFVDTIPRNTTGKILRRILQDRLRNVKDFQSLAQIRPEPFSEVWFTPSGPAQTPADPLLGSGSSHGQNDHKPPDERTIKLGKTLRTLSTLLPNILTTPLPPDIVSPNVVLHLFPSTHPHLPSVRGRVPYRAALWTAPVAWGSVPIVGNVKLRILSERVVRTGFIVSDSDPSSGNDTTGEEKLVVRWKTEAKSTNDGITPSTTTSTTAANSSATMSPSSSSASHTNTGGLNRGLSTLLGGDKPIFSLNSNDEFTGLFVFAFDDQGRIASHTIEHADENTGCDRTSRVVTLTDWLLGKAKLGRSDEDNGVGIPGLAVNARICRAEWDRAARERTG